MLVSIFNDVLGPVMRGPSSSHCAAALRIGRLARDLMGGKIERVLVEFDRSGSLPTTHASQGSDMGLFGGLLGWDAADERLPDSAIALRDAGIELSIETVDVGDPHPNTYRLTLSNATETHTLHAISTGGGMIEVIQIDGQPVSLFGDQEVCVAGRTLHPVLPVLTLPSSTVPFKSALGMLRYIESNLSPSDLSPSPSPGRSSLAGKGEQSPSYSPFPKEERLPAPRGYPGGRGERFSEETPLWKLAAQYEMQRGGLTEDEVLAKALNLIQILRRSIAQGLAGTHYDDRILGAQSPGFAAKLAAGQLLNGGALNRIVLYVTALMEVKSSMGVIVAAPTAGACAALPGAVIAMAEELGLDEREMAKAFLASGLIGVFITTRWSFAAEVGGCQAEGGSAACMAAAALVQLGGGTLTQSLAASSMALQNMLGLICDPIANRVEAPCLGKNVMAASNALSCANMALAGYDPLIPLDEVIETAKRVSAQMPRELRCTNLGGLSISPTSQAIEEKLLQLQLRRQN
ncbi:L-serine ammonia-lyase, iron-sulfur-dependent, subunit alpha [Armatimonas rosea]|uniref:L-serine ammonia-lyase n=1 Tax=Armatimonas rosea TaxID=685828 RepID=A0A7W9W6N8_ARMRO|nr:L-serine ammonia-lyase, iron-sulfur-dependent, subunit alpha [Armatimonas rosea]MBB6049757.1 L-serine dehydratase [Armatimonas rosea]